MLNALTQPFEESTSHGMKEAQAAEYIGMSVSFLRQARCRKPRSTHPGGPAFQKRGGSVRYLQSDLDRWLDRQPTEGADHA